MTISERINPIHVDESYRRYEASISSELLRRNGRQGRGVEREDSLYVPVAANPSFDLEASGPILYLGAHPADGPDFFYATYLKIMANDRYQNELHEVIVTDGGGGVDGWNRERTRDVREVEVHEGLKIVKGIPHLMGYTDGGLANLGERERGELVVSLAEIIIRLKPSLVVTHSPLVDHQDHPQVFLLGVDALKLSAQGGGKLPTFLVHDTEFGLRQQSVLNHKKVPKTDLNGFTSPGLIVDTTDTYLSAMYALYRHRTQMYDLVEGGPKNYADMIPKLAMLRGLQIRQKGEPSMPRGQGFSHIFIPGATHENNVLSARLSKGSLYERVR